ncbi:MAG: hypothetical protein WCI57_02310 [Candidatus Berkelbacteria bacterium]
MSTEKSSGYVDPSSSYEAEVASEDSKYESSGYEGSTYEADPTLKTSEYEADKDKSEAEKRRDEVLSYTRDRTERDREKIEKRAEGLPGLFDKFRRNSSARMVTGIALAVVSNGIPGASLPFQLARTALAAVGGGTSGEAMYLNKTENSFLNKFTTKDSAGKIEVNEGALSKLTPEELAELLGGLSQIATLKGLKVDLEALKADEAMIAKIKEDESKNAVKKNIEAMREWFAKMPWYMKIGLPLAAASLGFAGGAFAVAGAAVSYGLGFLGTKRMYAQTAYENTGVLKAVEEEILNRAGKGEITAEQLRLEMDKSSDKVEAGRKKWLVGGAAIGGGVSALLYGVTKSGMLHQADKHAPGFISDKDGDQPQTLTSGHTLDASHNNAPSIVPGEEDKPLIAQGVDHASMPHAPVSAEHHLATPPATPASEQGEPTLHLKNQDHLYHEGPGAAHNLAKEVLKATDSKLSPEQLEKAQDHLAADWEKRGLFKSDGSLAVPVKELIHEINGPAEGHEAALLARAQTPEIHHATDQTNSTEVVGPEVKKGEPDYDPRAHLLKNEMDSPTTESGIGTPKVEGAEGVIAHNPSALVDHAENKFESGDHDNYDDTDVRTVDGGIGVPSSPDSHIAVDAPNIHNEVVAPHVESIPTMSFISELGPDEKAIGSHLYQIAERGDVDKLRHLSEHVHDGGFWRSIPRETEWKWLLPDPKTAPDVMPAKEGEINGEWIGHRPGFIFRGKLNWEPRIEHDKSFLNHIAKANEIILNKFDHSKLPDEVPMAKGVELPHAVKETGPDSYETPESSKPTAEEIAAAARKPMPDDSILDGGRSTIRHEEVILQPSGAEEHIGKPSTASAFEQKQIDAAIADEKKLNEIQNNVDFFRTTPEEIDKMKATLFTPDMSDPVSKLTEPVYHGIKIPRIEDALVDMWKHDGNTAKIVELQNSVGPNRVPSQAEWSILWPKSDSMPKEVPTEVGSKVGEWISIKNLQNKFVWEPRVEYDASFRGAIVDRAWHIIRTNLK